MITTVHCTCYPPRSQPGRWEAHRPGCPARAILSLSTGYVNVVPKAEPNSGEDAPAARADWPTNIWRWLYLIAYCVVYAVLTVLVLAAAALVLSSTLLP